MNVPHKLMNGAFIYLFTCIKFAFIRHTTHYLHFLVETQSVQSAPAGDKLTPYPADFIKWWNVRCRFYVTAHAVQQSSDADFYPYTQSTASMILV